MSSIAIIILVGSFVFVLGREILCWYWKINEILKRMQEQEAKLDKYLKAIDSKLNMICEKGINVRIVSDSDSQTSFNDGKGTTPSGVEITRRI